mmetsp:Transcript_26225/g.39700  ORF Transcript_26225/g.39700 Transcript_26225/m.39700 type:complete len:267 (-) Transcript_26225:3574-4374(-)
MTYVSVLKCLALANFFLMCHALRGTLINSRRSLRTFSDTTPTRLQSAETIFSRRSLLGTVSSIPFIIPQAASAAFAPGGTLVEYEVGIKVGNEEASPSRKPNNSNVLFQQDYYFKFGTAAKFISPGSTDFPKTMPFVLSQQRYDNLKKYGDRVKKGASLISSLFETSQDEIVDPSISDVYQLRPMGLLANGFLASENTGTTNELLLARYYINEIYLDIGDMKNAPSQNAKKESWNAAKKSLNSYFGMLNRSINAKVGDQFELLGIE